MTDYKKPLPQADPITAPYWESLKNHEMKIQRCNDTGKYFFYPRGLSPYTLSSNISWEPVSGRGNLHAFTIVHAMRAPGFAEDVPYVVAIVELDEGAKLMSNLVDIEPDPTKIQIGMSLELVYDDVTEDVTLPKFRPL